MITYVAFYLITGLYIIENVFHALNSLSKQKINLAEISIGPIQCNWYLAHHDPRNFHCSTQTIYVYCFIYLIHGSAWIQQHRLNYDISKKVTFVKHKKIFLGVCVYKECRAYFYYCYVRMNVDLLSSIFIKHSLLRKGLNNKSNKMMSAKVI